MKTIKKFLLVALCAVALPGVQSCDDMLDIGNDYVIYTNEYELVDPADTVTSVIGILNKLQGIAVRTNLLGELRADLVTVSSNAISDLQDISNLDIQEGNSYNCIRDYYAVINNCNLYLASVDSTAGNANRNEKYFETEIAQVHSIRAWTYLQLALVYGSVPLVVDPVTTKLQSDAEYPMYDLASICDYFISDLQSYYGKAYPDYQSVGGDIDPQLCFFPTQVVMGDLYLYRACANQDKESAKSAAKCYYDYIMWDLSGKTYLLTGMSREYWSQSTLYSGTFRMPNSNKSSSDTWGTTNCSDITKIAMDAESSDGYYNELRLLYNSYTSTSFQEASIHPSDQLIALSEADPYVGYDTNNSLVTVSRDKLDDDALEDHLYGDLRFQANYSEGTYRSGTDEYDEQTIQKHQEQHVTIYRASQLYLRLAEALNYAGYPRFARLILTMGLNNNGINYWVAPYYPNDTDQSFLSYFDFNNNLFLPYGSSYVNVTNDYGVVTGVNTVLREESEVNMLGIHMRGSGDAYANSDYLPLAAPDSTDYPYDLYEQIPEAPVAPTVVPEPSGTLLSYDEWAATVSGTKTETRYNQYVSRYEDSVSNYAQYVADLATYTAAKAEFDAAVEAFKTAYDEWYNAAYTDASYILAEQKQIDQAILDEQALELSYEGNRFYDLMRRALWWNDNSKMVEPISKRTTNASKLNTRSNWYLDIE